MIAREIHVSDVAAVTARERPDVALVGLGESAEHALLQISEIVAEAFCPVIALLDTYDGVWVNEAAARGVFAYIVDSRPEELQSAIDITLRRFGEFQHLQGAFDRRNAETVRERTGAGRRSNATCSSSTTASCNPWPSPSSRSSSTGATTHVKRWGCARERPRYCQQIPRRIATTRSSAWDLIRDTAPG